MKIEIPLKLPSLNEYTQACRTKAILGAKMKRQVESDIYWFMQKLPKHKKPVKIKFTWHEGNAKRDLDNICFAKKFILDSLVKSGAITDDSRKYVQGFEDVFPPVGKEWKVVVEIIEKS